MVEIFFFLGEEAFVRVFIGVGVAVAEAAAAASSSTNSSVEGGGGLTIFRLVCGVEGPVGGFP